MTPVVGVPASRATLPGAWRARVPGLQARPLADTVDPLAALEAGDVAAAWVPARRVPEALLDGGGALAVVVPARAEPRDLLVPAEGRPTLGTLPRDGRVALEGTRRRALLAAHRPDLTPVALPPDPERTVAPFVRSGAADAVIVGAALARAAGIADDASEVLDPRAWLPAPAQGAWVLAVRSDDDDTRDALASLEDGGTRAALEAELTAARALDASDDSTLGVLALPYGPGLRIWGMLPSADGERVVRADISGGDETPAALGRRLAALLRERGAALARPGPGDGP